MKCFGAGTWMDVYWMGPNIYAYAQMNLSFYTTRPVLARIGCSRHCQHESQKVAKWKGRERFRRPRGRHLLKLIRIPSGIEENVHQMGRHPTRTIATDRSRIIERNEIPNGGLGNEMIQEENALPWRIRKRITLRTKKGMKAELCTRPESSGI